MRERSLPALFLGVLSCLLPGPVEAGRSAVAPLPGSALEATSVESAFGRGAACLGRDIDLNVGSAVFRDPYLTYVYPEERLPVPPGSRPLTYRQVDADTILVLLGRSGTVPEPLAAAAAEAAKSLSVVAPVWRGRGFSNVKRGSRPDGIALDTFCVVGWLNGDEAMAHEAAEAIDGDGWIPPGWYEGAERFRAAADESWCLRLLAATHRLDTVSSRVLDRILAEFRALAREAPADTGTFYEAWHLGMVGTETMDRGNGEAVVRARALVEEAVGVMKIWADAAKSRNDNAAGSDGILEWANLATSEALAHSGQEGLTLRDRSVAEVLARQEKDGCWSVPDVSSPRLGSSFLTLRALLALAPYRPSSATGAGAGRPLPHRPAP